MELKVAERTDELLKKTAEAEQLALVARYTDNSVVITDSQSRIKWVNEGFVRTTGYLLHEVKNCFLGDVLQGVETDAATINFMRDQLHLGHGFEVEVVHYDKQGEPYWVVIECRPIHDELGRITRFVSIESDIEANDAIIISEICPTDPHGAKILSVNAAFERMTDYLNSEVVGHNPRMLQGPGTDAATRKRIRDGLRKWQPVRAEMLNYRKDGAEFWVKLNITPLADEHGWFTHGVSVQRNITERKERERERSRMSQELADASRQAGMAEVATGVLHNVGNVLNSVNVTAPLLLDRNEKSPLGSLRKASHLINEHKDDLGSFVTSHPGGRHLSQFLTQLSEKLSEDKVVLPEELLILNRHVEHIKQIVNVQQSFATSPDLRAEVDLHQLIEDAMLTLRDTFCLYSICVVRELEDVPEMISDKHQILQILINL